MDDLERRLREDAEAIRAEVPPQLTARIASSVRGARALPPARREFGWPLWLAASLTGAAAAAVAIVALNRGSMDTAARPPAGAVADSVPDSVPNYILEFEQLPLHAKTADLTAPLEEELRNLRSDLERARENVQQDLDFTF
jgi:hypothetical protein